MNYQKPTVKMSYDGRWYVSRIDNGEFRYLSREFTWELTACYFETHEDAQKHLEKPMQYVNSSDCDEVAVLSAIERLIELEEVTVNESGDAIWRSSGEPLNVPF